jgi:hypothetical protein
MISDKANSSGNFSKISSRTDLIYKYIHHLQYLISSALPVALQILFAKYKLLIISLVVII